jgi:DNA polymerase III epsilon subunit-like protein
LKLEEKQNLKRVLQPTSKARDQMIKRNPASRLLGRPVVLVVDLETTGPLNPALAENYGVVKDRNQPDLLVKVPVHQIIEIGIVRLDLYTGETWPVLERRFKPTVPIVAAAHRLHKLSAAKLSKEAAFATWAGEIVSLLRRADQVVMHMAAWDATVLNHQLRTAGK